MAASEMVSSIPIMYLDINRIARRSRARRCFLLFHKSRRRLVFARMPDMPIEFPEPAETLPTDRRTGNYGSGGTPRERFEAVEATASAEDHRATPLHSLAEAGNRLSRDSSHLLSARGALPMAWERLRNRIRHVLSR